jgi:hypothetical protein
MKMIGGDLSMPSLLEPAMNALAPDASSLPAESLSRRLPSPMSVTHEAFSLLPVSGARSSIYVLSNQAPPEEYVNSD